LLDADACSWIWRTGEQSDGEREEERERERDSQGWLSDPRMALIIPSIRPVRGAESTWFVGGRYASSLFEKSYKRWLAAVGKER
jgi:hypothetical protein